MLCTTWAGHIVHRELKTLGSPSPGSVKLQGQDVLGMLWKCSSKVEEMGKNENGDYSVC